MADTTFAAIKAFMHIISFMRVIATALSSILYGFVKTVSVHLVKVLLIPFIGPFAWLISLVLDVGITFIEWFIDLKDKITDYVEWFLNNSYPLAGALATELRLHI